MAADGQNKKWRDHICSHKLKADRGNWKWEKAINSQSPPLVTEVFQEASPSKPPYTAPPTGDRVFKS